MKKRFILLIIISCCCILTAFAAPMAYADMGPHPAVTIDFRNLNTEIYATLLSEDWSPGPNTAYLPDEENEVFAYRHAEWITSDGKMHNVFFDWDEAEVNAEYLLADQHWQSFQDYSMQDEYYFLQRWWEFDGNGITTLEWGYYAPQRFKLLLYFAEYDTFVCSAPYKSYAIHSYYTVDLEQITRFFNSGDAASTEPTVTLEYNYDYLGEVLGLLFRVAVTVLAELLVALVFRLGSYRQLKVIVFTNLATQLVLNVLINIFAFYGATILFLLCIIPLELLVFAVEATVYSVIWRKDVQVWKSVVYAFTSNLVSFLLGLGLGALFPFLF